MPKSGCILLLFLFGWVSCLPAQTVAPIVGVDTTDTRLTVELQDIPVTRSLPEPSKVVWWAAAIPGYGQILNGKYWKLPIVYAGFLGCYYAVKLNSNRYISYKSGYLDITDTDNTTNSYLNLLPPGRTIESYGGTSAYTGLLKSGMEKSRYYRDLTVIVSVAFYGLSIIDAFVDAHLADFDISPELSMQLRPLIQRESPALFNNSSAYTYGLTGRVKF